MTEEQKAARPKQQPKRTPLPPELPRTLLHHEPENTQCRCGCQLKRIGEDVSEKLDYVPGEHARTFLGDWQGILVCDDYAGYKAGFGNGITEIGCMAHARCKFYDLHEANKSELAAKALEYIGGLYEIERETKDLPPDKRKEIREAKAKPIADALHQWMLAHRQKVPDGSGTAKALDYNLKRWDALTRYLDDGAVPIDNNWVENQIRPWALGRSNWLLAGSLRSGQRAAAVMTLIQSAKLNGHDPYDYLKDVLTRLPTQKNRAINELLPHQWKSAMAAQRNDWSPAFVA